MDHFSYKNGALHAENVAISSIAKSVGTPFYCYSAATLTRHATVFQEALAPLRARVCFAVKANSNLAVLALLGRAGLGADVVSEGEARRALAAGIPPERIVFSGIGKTRAELAFGLNHHLWQFNVESALELMTLGELARDMGKKPRIALRVNPDVDAATHAKISTGKKENKFGIRMEDAAELFALAHSLPSLDVAGVSVHIGSQLTSLAPFRAAYYRVRSLVELLRERGLPLRSIDLGGGLGVPYDGEAPPAPAAYGALVKEIFGDLDIELVFEPGRMIAANAGILVTQVIYVKSAARTYVIVDAGMNDLLRPALYDAKHAVIPIHEISGENTVVDLVGPVCESSDVFVKDLPMTLPKEGDLLALRSAGAYGATMASGYNSRLLIPEVLVSGDRFAVIRARPSYEELLAHDTIPEWV